MDNLASARSRRRHGGLRAGTDHNASGTTAPLRSRLGSTYRLALWRRDDDRRETVRPFLCLRSTLRQHRSRGARSQDCNQAERRDGRAQPALDRTPLASIAVALIGMTTRTSMAWPKMTMIYEIQHLTARRRSSLPVSAVAATFCPRPKRQMHRLLVRHRSTPPDAFAHDHDRQQVSWLAGHRLRPPSQGPCPSPVVFMVVGYPLTVAGAAAALHTNLRVPHSLG